MAAETGGRPAKLFRFRREVLLERAVAGTSCPCRARPSDVRIDHSRRPLMLILSIIIRKCSE